MLELNYPEDQLVPHCSIITIIRPLRAWYSFIILNSR